ncbi:MAG: carbon-nitrogen family hydrolase [Desulfotignum sp.]|nr:carbon-nitrogen family hydrolase [Desulfotignum sp.]MCF8086936.1 carbon-nitrogen family hydrolase [Desulfotignum sp.]MCF8137202.1 carbon-nitrogen family hydrolase [Desulfotignum sp.]
MKVAALQLSVKENDPDATVDQAEKAIRSCPGADLVILPEIWPTGFMSFDRYEVDAQPLDGPLVTRLRALAKEMKVMLHTGSFVEKDGGRLYNTSALVSADGEILGVYRKIHLFGFQSRETQILTPGDTPVVVKTPFGNLGMATCFDLRFPELFRAMVDQGADMFLVCSAWPYPRLPAWIMLNRVRALENQCHLICANSCGLNNGSQFVGHSMVVDPWGTILAGAGDGEAIVSTRIDPAVTQAARDTFPGLAGRKPFLNPGMPPGT